MPPIANKEFVDSLIQSQRNAIRYHLLFAVGIIVIGLLLILFTFILSEYIKADGLKTILSLGGGLVSSLSGFQLKEILQRKEKIGVYETVKVRINEMEKQDNADSVERAKVEDLLWKLVEKTALG